LFSNPECSFPLFQWNDVQIFISQNRSQFSFFQFIRFEKSYKWLLSSRTYSISFCLFFRLLTLSVLYMFLSDTLFLFLFIFICTLSCLFRCFFTFYYNVIPSPFLTNLQFILALLYFSVCFFPSFSFLFSLCSFRLWQSWDFNGTLSSRSGFLIPQNCIELFSNFALNYLPWLVKHFKSCVIRNQTSQTKQFKRSRLRHCFGLQIRHSANTVFKMLKKLIF